MTKIYALYKGEKLLADGTMIQIANKMGVKLETIRFYSSKVYARRVKERKSNKSRELVLLEE